MPVQLRFETGLTGAEYVSKEAWRLASLKYCPVHPQGGCGFASHGTYGRKTPPGTLIQRWYCRAAHVTFSLLPDHLAARFPGTLCEIEEVVATYEQGKTVAATADALRGTCVLFPSAVRWVRRRLALVRAVLSIVVGLYPQLLRGCAPSIAGLRGCLGCPQVLMQLREVAQAHLQTLPRPLGFHRRSLAVVQRKHRRQQSMGPAPPPRAT
jgi:hypothetical protein